MLSVLEEVRKLTSAADYLLGFRACFKVVAGLLESNLAKVAAIIVTAQAGRALAESRLIADRLVGLIFGAFVHVFFLLDRCNIAAVTAYPISAIIQASTEDDMKANTTVIEGFGGLR